MAEKIEMPFGEGTSTCVGPRNHVLGGGFTLASRIDLWRWRCDHLLPLLQQRAIVRVRFEPERRSCSFFDHRNGVPVLFGI